MHDRDILMTLRPASAAVNDPISGTTLWLANIVRKPRVEHGALRYELHFPEGYSPGARHRLQLELQAAIRAQGYDGPIHDHLVDATTEAPAVAEGAKPALPRGVQRVLAIASGKGGVGKSTVATNLATALAASGLRVGLFDADVYGPSLPRMMGTRQRQPVGRDKRIVPVLAHGVQCVSIGLVVDPDQALIWRGPMVDAAIRQLLDHTNWGELDVLLLDLPPGTGDAQLTLVQAIGITGAVIVTTPQPVALEDAVRGIRMFRDVGVPVIGIIENMAGYIRQDGSRDPIFGSGGGARLAQEHGVPLLGQIPLQTAIREAGDEGQPAALQPGPHGDALRTLASTVRAQIDA